MRNVHFIINETNFCLLTKQQKEEQNMIHNVNSVLFSLVLFVAVIIEKLI